MSIKQQVLEEQQVFVQHQISRNKLEIRNVFSLTQRTDEGKSKSKVCS